MLMCGRCCVQGDWQTANMAAHMQARMQHQQGTGQQLPPPQMGPFAGPGSFPYFGECCETSAEP